MINQCFKFKLKVQHQITKSLIIDYSFDVATECKTQFDKCVCRACIMLKYDSIHDNWNFISQALLSARLRGKILISKLLINFSFD